MSKPIRACDFAERVAVYALQALPADESPMVEAHIADCLPCRDELNRLRPIVDFFVAWPTDVLRPSPSLRERLARRIAADTGGDIVMPTVRQCSEPDWEEVAPGISCKLLATDIERNRVSMLVRLAPGVEYPPHRHAGVEELHLLDGELWINERKLQAGDFSHAEPGTSDRRVWSETGCTCVLITSSWDVLG
jgi:anti-sigma factor ChrR (cupin superfamily)